MNTSADLSGLYPHMAGAAPDASKLDAALREALLAKCRDSVEVKSRFFETHADELMRAAHLLADSFRNGGRLYTMGNGGSACDAAHIAVATVSSLPFGPARSSPTSARGWRRLRSAST